MIQYYFDRFNELPYGESYIHCPWGTEHTDVGYAFEGIEIFMKFIEWCKENDEDEEDED